MTGPGRYTVLRKIADGGMAEIYLGTQHGAAGFSRPVIIKAIRRELSADEHFRNMLIDEAHIAMSLNHGSIVQVLDVGESGGRYYLVLELIEGWDLDHVLRRAQTAGLPLPTPLALYVIAEVCRALAYAHGKERDGKPLGIVHRDISPQNVLVSEQGEVKLADFGIATASDRREKTNPGLVKGKVGFMSPEQAMGLPLDARSDLFSLGTTLYLMLTGVRPFAAATDLESMLRTKDALFDPPRSVRSDLEPAVAEIVHRAMRKERDERYASAQEMLVDVERVLRTAVSPAGQTELQAWLKQLSQRDGVASVTRAPPPIEVSDGSIVPIEGSALVLSDVPARPIPLTQPLDSKPEPAAPLPPAPRPRELSRPKRSGVAPVLFLVALAAMVGLVLHLNGAQPTLEAVPDSGEQLTATEPAPAAPVAAAQPAQPDSGAAAPDDSDDTPEVAQAGAVDEVEVPEPEAKPEPAPAPEAHADAGVAPSSVASPAPKPAKATKPVERNPVVLVQVVSEPPGAMVRVAKKPYGPAPLRLKFRSGLAYDIAFDKSGYESAERHVYVNKGKAQVVRVTMKKKGWWPF